MGNNWTQVQLQIFSKADDMYISPFYEDGKTPGTPTWIWSVAADNDLYVRAYNGQNSRWYQSAVKQRAGKIKLAGQEYGVFFEPVESDSALTEKINQAYKEKYSSSRYLTPMIGKGPVSATVKILPKNE
ncbi:DUF2255 family protein [Oceanobacillus neutriphilus]|uniref:DUF2255 family protein n=1 Tax=Oceanobacillus neutriphilus TaxID=531815 RepID=A0ABQ2NQS5_9BACI|nr:DUF2255 family protein [Oceanobacillus neutriphilus]GGP08867.1 hypothetical protein GCM10011346_10900 [Oceanobacillus neutriphilus]